LPGAVTASRIEFDTRGRGATLGAMKRDAVPSRSQFLFAVWPYLALAAFAAGAGTRFAVKRSQADRIVLALTQAEPLLRARGLWIGSFLILFLGHLAGLLFPGEILRWNASPARLHTLEATAFAAGLGAFAGWACMMWLRLRAVSGSVVSQMADIIFLSLLFAVLVSGLAAAALYRWSSSWGVLTATPYVLSVLRGKPVVGLAEEMPFFLRLHIFSAFALAPVLPFTSVAPRLIDAAYRGCGWLLGPIRCLAQRARMAFADWIARHNPGARIWPEED
jgi:nitrate reductase gamma subunit